jgi:hypothetical protein
MTKSLITIASSLILMACAAPSAPDYSGGWVPVNQFESEIKTIPKTRPYVYGAIKLDTTLSTMSLTPIPVTVTIHYPMPSQT